MLTCVVGSYLTVIATVSLLDLRTSVETNRRGEMKATRVSVSKLTLNVLMPKDIQSVNCINERHVALLIIFALSFDLNT